MKIGAITVGQSPRTDVTADILKLFSADVQLLERGGLDGLSQKEIEAFAPESGDYILVSRMTDGTSVTFAEKHVLPRLQDAIRDLERQGVKLIMMFCTGKFPDTLTSNVPLIYPCDLLDRIVPLLTHDKSIVVVTPSPLQIEQSLAKWSKIVPKVKVVSASPYEAWEPLKALAESLIGTAADLIVLDCIGYSEKMKKQFAQTTGIPVVLPRTLLARVVSEITNDAF